MKIVVSGRNLKVTDRVREQIESKLSKYDRYFNTDIEATVTLSHIKKQQVLEITIPLKNDVIFRVEEVSDDMLKSLDNAVDKLDRQIAKHKTSLKKRYQSHDTIRFEEIKSSEPEVQLKDQIVRSKSFPIKPMDPEEAVLQMEMLGHNFFVFLNGDTEEVNVVYQRKNGGYGLIEPEF